MYISKKTISHCTSRPYQKIYSLGKHTFERNSAICTVKCLFLIYGTGKYKQAIINRKSAGVKSLNLFKDTPENILADLAPLMKEIQYEQGTEIFKEGETR